MNNKICVAAVCIMLLPISTSWAGVGKISTPEVDKGEFEVEQSSRRYGDDSNRAKNNAQKHTTEIEYGFTDDIMLGLEFISERKNTSQFGLEEYGVEGQYEFTSQKHWWLASALKAEYVHARERGEPDEGEVKLLLQRDEGKIRTVANLNFVRQLGSDRNGGVGFESALQSIYRCNKYASGGLEWFAEYGNIDNLNSPSRQEHYIGPVIQGELFELAGGEIGYEAGYYWGVTNASADNAQRITISYETHF